MTAHKWRLLCSFNGCRFDSQPLDLCYVSSPSLSTPVSGLHTYIIKVSAIFITFKDIRCEFYFTLKLQSTIRLCHCFHFIIYSFTRQGFLLQKRESNPLQDLGKTKPEQKDSILGFIKRKRQVSICCVLMLLSNHWLI